MTKNKNNEVTIRSSAAEYLNYVASVGEEIHNVEVRYEDGKNYNTNHYNLQMISSLNINYLFFYVSSISFAVISSIFFICQKFSFIIYKWLW